MLCKDNILGAYFLHLQQELHPVCLSIFRGADPLGVAEALGEIAGGGEAQHGGDLGQAQVCLRQEPLALLDPAGDQIIDGGDAVFPLEGVGHVIFVDAGLLRQQVQGQILLIMLLDVLPDRGALAVRREPGLTFGDGDAGGPHEPDHDDVHVGHADGLIVGLSVLHLLQELLHTIQDLVVFREGVDAVPGLPGVRLGQLQSLDAQDDVFQGMGLVADLRVDDVGIHHHKLVGPDGEELLVDLELAVAADDVIAVDHFAFVQFV